MSTIIGLVSTFRLPLHLLAPFGLPPASPLPQGLILRYFSLLLDFRASPHYLKVQSAALSRSFWTFSCLPSTSKSILPLLLAPFGLPHISPPPQSPIHSPFLLLLDFRASPLHFKVHSATLCTSQQKVDITLYFYTSFNEHNTPYTVLESDNSESMPDVLH